MVAIDYFCTKQKQYIVKLIDIKNKNNERLECNSKEIEILRKNKSFPINFHRHLVSIGKRFASIFLRILLDLHLVYVVYQVEVEV